MHAVIDEKSAGVFSYQNLRKGCLDQVTEDELRGLLLELCPN